MPFLSVHVLTFCVHSYTVNIGCMVGNCCSCVAFCLSFKEVLESCEISQWFSLCSLSFFSLNTYNVGKSQLIPGLMYCVSCWAGNFLKEKNDVLSLWWLVSQVSADALIHFIPVPVWMLAFLSWSSCVASVIRCLFLYVLDGFPLRRGAPVLSSPWWPFAGLFSVL